MKHDVFRLRVGNGVGDLFTNPCFGVEFGRFVAQLEVEYGPLEAEISISEDETPKEEELIKAEEQLDENQKDFE